MVEGLLVGKKLGLADGDLIGLCVCPADGAELGLSDGLVEGLMVGKKLGPSDGGSLGLCEGLGLGPEEGLVDGNVDGVVLGGSKLLSVTGATVGLNVPVQ
jgi:hypothetical protein